MCCKHGKIEKCIQILDGIPEEKIPLAKLGFNGMMI